MKQRTLSVLLVVLLWSGITIQAIGPVMAAMYRIDLHGREGGMFAANIADYTIQFSAEFEIDASAVIADNLVLFTDPEFLAFSMFIPSGPGFQLTLGVDRFPGQPSITTGVITRAQGLLLGSDGRAARFDTPSTSASNSATIRDSADTAIPFTNFGFFDNDDQQNVLLPNGSIVDRDILAPGDPFDIIPGGWFFNPNVSNGGPALAGIYFISPAVIPVPAALPLFMTALAGLGLLVRRQRRAA